MGSNGKSERQKQERLGEVGYNNDGDKMVIVEYYNATNITVEFENGFKVTKAKYGNFKRGNISNPINNPENRIGETKNNNSGLEMTIIKYNNYNDITVQFKDGVTVCAGYGEFKKGTIRKPDDRVGEIGYNNYGERMIIIEYKNSADITVQFDNGYKVFEVSYQRFKNGAILNPINKAEGRLGEVNYNNQGSRMTIIEYNNYDDITVQFDNKYSTKNNYGHFRSGDIRNPYDRTVFGHGYIGEISTRDENGEESYSYKIWQHMLRRCYDPEFHKKFPTYKNCEASEDWLCYANFKKWCDENFYEIEGEPTVELDKDILVKGNKLYSESTSIFTPKRINELFIKKDANRGKYPIGVSYEKDMNNYKASCSTTSNNRVHIGRYNSPEEAFYKGYKPFKEAYIKKIANEYKGKIPDKLYQSMMMYKVEITD